MNKENISRVVAMLGGVSNIELFADNGRLFVSDDAKGAIIFDDVNEIAYVVETNNTAIQNGKPTVAALEYGILQFIDATLEPSELEHFFTELGTNISDFDKLRLRAAYNYIPKVEAITQLELLGLPVYEQLRYSILWKLKDKKTLGREIEEAIEVIDIVADQAEYLYQLLKR